MSEDNICEQCGGILRFEYTITFERCTPVMVRYEPSHYSSPFRLCPGHPGSTSKHDGNLSGYSNVEYQVLPDRTWVRLREYEETWSLSPTEALSLLSWLQQERPTLEKLAKDEEG